MPANTTQQHLVETVTENGELPEGWATASLQDVGVWGSGGTPLKSRKDFYEGGSIPWLKIGDLDDNVVTEAKESITELGLASSAAKVLPVDTLLIAMYGSIGKLGVTGIKCATNQAIAYCFPKIDLWYLFWVLRWAREDLLNLGKGGTQANISQTVLKTFTIPVPPLAEQRRIVDGVEALLAEVNAARDHLAKVPAIMKRFRQAVLTAACTGRLTEEWRTSRNTDVTIDSSLLATQTLEWERGDILPDSWRWQRLGLLADCRLGKMLDKARNTGSPVHYLRNVNVRWFTFALDDLSEINIEDTERDTFSLRNGDVLVCEGGEPGRAAVWRDGKTNLVFQKALHRIRLPHPFVPEWFVFNLKLDAESHQLDQLFTGSTIKHLTGVSLSRYPVIVPPRTEQVEIVRRVDALFALADGIERHVHAATARANRVTQAVLAKAFRGELVPTEAELAAQEGRDYEPASVLLERIRAERGQVSSTRRHRRQAKTRLPLKKATRLRAPVPKPSGRRDGGT